MSSRNYIRRIWFIFLFLSLFIRFWLPFFPFLFCHIWDFPSLTSKLFFLSPLPPYASSNYHLSSLSNTLLVSILLLVLSLSIIFYKRLHPLILITERHAILTFIVTCIIPPTLKRVQFPAIRPRYEWNCFLALAKGAEFCHSWLRRLTLIGDKFLLCHSTSGSECNFLWALWHEQLSNDIGICW